MKRIVIFYLGSLLAFNGSIQSKQNRYATQICANSMLYKNFIIRWNLEIKNIKSGTWNLSQLPFSKDTVNIIQSLDGPSLYFEASVLKTGCIKSVSIKSRRDQNIGAAALVAWIKLSKTIQPELTNAQRVTFLMDTLELSKPNPLMQLAYSSAGINKIKAKNLPKYSFSKEKRNGQYLYVFKEGSSGNIFTIYCNK